MFPRRPFLKLRTCVVQASSARSRLHQQSTAINNATIKSQEDAAWSLQTGAATIHQPPFPLDQQSADGSSSLSGGLVSFLERRGWKIDDPKGTEAPEERPQVRMLSQLLTFPLTLSYVLTQLRLESKVPLNVVFVGARAEGTLPHIWWEELLYSSPLPLDSLTFIGPELVVCRANTVKSQGQELALHWKRGLFHEVPNLSETSRGDVLYVLFNPGLCHPALKESWAPTLDRLLETKRPIIMTSHSKSDLDRDVNLLKEGAAHKSLEWLLRPALNPFRCLRETVDKREGEDGMGGVVASNTYLYAIKGSG